MIMWFDWRSRSKFKHIIAIVGFKLHGNIISSLYIYVKMFTSADWWSVHDLANTEFKESKTDTVLSGDTSA